MQAGSCWRRAPSWQACQLATYWLLPRRWVAVAPCQALAPSNSAAVAASHLPCHLPTLTPRHTHKHTTAATTTHACFPPHHCLPALVGPLQGCLVRKAWVRPNFKQGGSIRRIQLAPGSSGRASECGRRSATAAPGPTHTTVTVHRCGARSALSVVAPGSPRAGLACPSCPAASCCCPAASCRILLRLLPASR